MHVEDIAHTMPISDTRCLLDKLLPMFGLQANMTYAVHAFSSVPPHALILGNIFSFTRMNEAHGMHTLLKRLIQHVNDSVPVVVVKQEGGSHGS